jgi:hypothetical protein
VAYDFASMLSTDVVDIPEEVVRREVEYKPGPFDELMKAGPTPEGKGYPMTVPEAQRRKGSDFRKELEKEIARCERQANKPARFGGWKVNDSDADLRIAVGTTGTGLILTVERKRKTGPRKASTTPQESDKSGKPNVRKNERVTVSA